VTVAGSLLKRSLFQASARGDFKRILRLLPKATSEDVMDTSNQVTVLHRLLQYKFNMITRGNPSGKMFKQYRTTLKRVTKLVDPSLFCPLVDAVHYRLSTSLNILVEAMTAEQIRQCFSELDVNGDHVLHIAAKSKASGFARHLLTSRRNSGRTNRELDVKPIPKVVDSASFSELNHHDIVGSADLDVLLDVGKRVGLLANMSWYGRRNNYGETPLVVACRAGRVGVVERLLRVVSISHERETVRRENQYNMTCAHIAAARGHVDVLQAALAASLSHDVQVLATGGVSEENKKEIDIYGRTVLDVACMSGRTGVVLYFLARASDRNEQNEFVELCLSAARNVTGGEVDRLKCLFATNPKEKTTCINIEREKKTKERVTGQRTDIPVRTRRFIEDGGWQHRNITDTTRTVPYIRPDDVTIFFRDFYTLRRPVVVRYKQEIQEWPASQKWKKESFLNTYGDVSVDLSVIPHAVLYDQPIHRSTIRDFISSWETKVQMKDATMDNDLPLHDSPFLFDGEKLLSSIPGLKNDIGELPKVFNFTQGSRTYLHQFSLGSIGSGAQYHFHGDAWNALVYGEKKWKFVAPPNGKFAINKICSTCSSSMMIGETYEVIQKSGDFVYVPEYWSHSTSNLGENIGIAYEFY
jgi:ankyrin repeat protein